MPQAVYEGATRVDLADVRVFNGQGEVVPHAMKPRPGAGTVRAPWIAVPFFPLRGGADSATDGLDVRAQRTAAGTIVRVLSSKPSAGTPLLLGYLVDITSLTQPIQALDLDWREASGEGLSGSLRVEASDDLQRWHAVVPAAPLVSLEYGGQRLVQRTVEIPAAQRKYLRVTWPQGQKPIELTRLRVRPSDVVLEPDRQWKPVPLRSSDKPGEFRFEPGGMFPLDRLRVSLPQPNTLASVQILARHAEDQPWKLLSTGVLYRLRHAGQDVVNADLSVTGSGWEQWLLRADQRGGGLGSEMPRLEVGWIPQQLVFVARGEGPFELAYGNVRAKPAELPIEILVPGWRGDAELKAAAATPGLQRTLAGQRALKAAPDYTTWTLWTSLLAGVLVLGWMAWRLAKELKRTPAKTPDSKTTPVP